MGVRHIIPVELHLDSDSKAYQALLKKAKGDEFRAGVLVENAVSELLEDLLEQRVCSKEEQTK